MQRTIKAVVRGATWPLGNFAFKRGAIQCYTYMYVCMHFFVHAYIFMYFCIYHMFTANICRYQGVFGAEFLGQWPQEPPPPPEQEEEVEDPEAFVTVAPHR